ncbi:MAG: hypothetical protein QOK19_1282 [Solirubrobacteraceae bacterium]|jgi:hypothetical protein|nr:hypothetical protein [Solirubrobacteraceae bacterium]
MKVVRFPTPAERSASENQSAAIDAALNGETAGVEADALRELRADVRSLAAPLDADFERELQSRLAEWGARRGRPRRSLNARRAGLRRRLVSLPGRSLALGGAGASVAMIMLLLVTIGPLRSGHGGGPAAFSASEGSALPRPAQQHTSRSSSGGAASSEGPARADLEPPPAAASGAVSAAAPGRLQQLGASVALATSPSGVQQVADSVARVGVGDGGYVRSSHVQVRSNGPSEALLTLSIPSAKLSSAIAALGRIASVRSIDQESQDITSSFDSARRQLADAEAVRRALLKALAAATTQGQIDSLREQLNGNRASISRDRAALHAVSRRAATSQLEVTITGGAGGEAHEGLTLHRGLHDAGRVLAVAGAVLLIALAALVPLAVVGAALDALRRAWRRRRREAALDS